MGEKAPRDFDEKRLMLAKPYEALRISSWKGVTIEPKLDGVRCVIFVKPDKKNADTWIVSFYSRNGRALTMFDHLLKEVGIFVHALIKHDDGFAAGAFLDGEMVSITGDFADISGAIHRKNYTEEAARFVCFHAMPLACWKAGVDSRSQTRRRETINSVIARKDFELIWMLETRDVKSDDDVWQAFKEFRADGCEGAMIKKSLEPWEAKRSFRWMKVKAELTVDVRVIDIQEGKGKYEGMLGFLVFKHKGVEVTCGGMTDTQRKQWWAHPKRIIGKMIEVTCDEITKAGSLRFPRFKRLRLDRS